MSQIPADLEQKLNTVLRIYYITYKTLQGKKKRVPALKSILPHTRVQKKPFVFCCMVYFHFQMATIGWSCSCWVFIPNLDAHIPLATQQGPTLPLSHVQGYRAHSLDCFSSFSVHAHLMPWATCCRLPSLTSKSDCAWKTQQGRLI